MIVKIEDDGFGKDVKHADVVDEDVLDNSAPATAGLEAQSGVCPEEGAACDADVPDTTGHFAADDESAMGMKDGTTMDNDPLTRNALVPARKVLAALDADGVIADIEGAVVDDDVGASVDVNGVTVLAIGGVTNVDVADTEVATQGGVETPVGGVLEGDTVKDHVGAVHEADHDGTKEVFDGFKLVLVIRVRDDPRGHASKKRSLSVGFGREPLVAMDNATALGDSVPELRGDLASLDVSPYVSIAVNDSASCDGDVIQVLPADGRLAKVSRLSHEVDGGEGIEVLVTQETNDCTRKKMEVNVIT